MNKTILIIDDDKALCASLAKGLRAAGFAAIIANGADQADEIMKRIVPDAIVLDRMMVGTDGLTALSTWRARGMTTPVIMLTALSGPANAIDGLTVGADDYLSKPFQLKELILRLYNIMRISAVTAIALPDGLILADGEFYVNAPQTGNRLMALSSAEKELLAALTAPVGNVAVAPPMVAKRLREKISANLKNVDIITVRGKGYKIVIK